MVSKTLQPGDAHHLEKFVNIHETPYSDVCQLLELKLSEPENSLEIDNCIFLFDPQNNYVFSSAVILGSTYGFFGVKVGTNWLKSAEKLESQGFIQADNLERFTQLGEDVSISVYLYPDNCPDTTMSTVKDYSVCARYGRAV